MTKKELKTELIRIAQAAWVTLVLLFLLWLAISSERKEVENEKGFKQEVNLNGEYVVAHSADNYGWFSHGYKEVITGDFMLEKMNPEIGIADEYDFYYTFETYRDVNGRLMVELVMSGPLKSEGYALGTTKMNGTLDIDKEGFSIGFESGLSIRFDKIKK